MFEFLNKFDLEDKTPLYITNLITMAGVILIGIASLGWIGFEIGTILLIFGILGSMIFLAFRKQIGGQI